MTVLKDDDELKIRVQETTEMLNHSIKYMIMFLAVFIVMLFVIMMYVICKMCRKQPKVTARRVSLQQKGQFTVANDSSKDIYGMTRLRYDKKIQLENVNRASVDSLASVGDGQRPPSSEQKNLGDNLRASREST